MKSRLEQAYREAECIWIDRASRIVCMSDCHRGVGNRGDNFLPNRNIFLAALQYYYDCGFSYMELGDGDELWENKGLSRIVDYHSDIFLLLARFHHVGRFQMLYGNHDCRKKNGKFLQSHCRECYCEGLGQRPGRNGDWACDCSERGLCEEGCRRDLFGEIQAKESILLKDRSTGHEILLLHGHQGDLMNDFLWPLTAFLVRYVWRPLELFGVYDPTSAARNYKKRKKTEMRLGRFAEKKQILVIAGHTHRSVLPQPGESFYLNDGSCVHPSGITAMELENGRLTLVKWSVTVKHSRNLSVEREVLAGPVAWEDYWKS